MKLNSKFITFTQFTYLISKTVQLVFCLFSIVKRLICLFYYKFSNEQYPLFSEGDLWSVGRYLIPLKLVNNRYYAYLIDFGLRDYKLYSNLTKLFRNVIKISLFLVILHYLFSLNYKFYNQVCFISKRNKYINVFNKKENFNFTSKQNKYFWNDRMAMNDVLSFKQFVLIIFQSRILNQSE